MTTYDPPEHIRQVLQRLEEDGHAAYLVGGCVRDAAMGRSVNDWDVATSATPGEVSRLFKKTILTGEKFGTVTVVVPGGDTEVTTFRTEGEYLDGRRPESVSFTSSIEEDLSRRDFTINAMALSLSGELVDPFGGLRDIGGKLIRCVGAPDERFKEDALRMFRAFRFSAQLGFDIEPGTMASIYANAGKSKLISAERVRIELEKTMLSQRPKIIWEIIKAGLLNKFMQGRRLNTDEEFTALPAESNLRWSLFCAILLDNGLISDADGFLRKMRLDAKTVKACSTALAIQGFPGERIGIKRLLASHGTDAVRCAAALNDALHGGVALKNTDEAIHSGECFSLKTLAISGRDLMELGLQEGSGLGETLSELLDHVIGRPEDNTRRALLKIVEESGKI